MDILCICYDSHCLYLMPMGTLRGSNFNNFHICVPSQWGITDKEVSFIQEKTHFRRAVVSREAMRAWLFKDLLAKQSC